MITVKVPATTANLGSGFDSLGLALDLELKVDVKLSQDKGKVHFKGYGDLQIEQNPASNLIVKSMQKLFLETGESMPPVDIYIENNIPLGKGLGSSAAAIVAGLYAGNFLLKNKFREEDLINIAVAMEGHADNVVPAVVGGLTAVMMEDGQVYYQKLPFPDELKIVMAVPDFILPTTKARKVLPQSIDIKDVIVSLQKACYLMASFCSRDFKFLDIAMNDKIFQPVRKNFIPGFDEVASEAKKSGALGVAVSGAGPSVIAFSLENEQLIGEKIRDIWTLHGISSEVFYLKVHENGVNFINTF